MSKSKLLVPSLDFGEATVDSKVPSVVGVKPVGSQVLLEVLTAQELMQTSLIVSDKTEVKVPLHAYVRAAGPSVKTEDWGFKVGDRVLISGTGIMAPKYDESERDRFFMEPHCIKAVLLEKQ